MKISILTSSDFPYGGAAETFVRNLALGFKYSEIDIEIIRLRGKKYKNLNETNNLEIKCSNYLFSYPANLNLLKFLELFCIICYMPFFSFFRKFVKKDNVIILYGIEYSYQILFMLLFSKFLNFKCIRIITDNYIESSISPVWWKRPKYWAYMMQQKYLDKYLDGIIVLSHYLYKNSLKNGVRKKNLLLIPHFIEINDIAYDIPDNSEYTIAFCGTVNVQNGVIDLIKAFKIVNSTISNTQLLIIGKISEDMKMIINKLGIELKNIIFTGQLNKQQVEETLKKCSILVNPRRKSEWAEAGFPTKLGEYFAMKKPVVTTKLGDLMYYFKDKFEVVFAEPNNIESIAESILFLYENPLKSQEIAENGFHWAKDNLEYRKNALKLKNFVYQL